MAADLSNSSFSMRIARETDVSAIAHIEQISFLHPGERFSDRRVRYLIRSPRTEVCVAETNGTVNGWIAGFSVLRSSRPWGHIYALAVDPAERGKNIGRMLLLEMIGLLRDKGASRLFLEVRLDNHAAVRLYETAGFIHCRRLENFYGPGLPAMRMMLEQI